MAAYYHYFSFGLSPYIEGVILRVREAVFQVFMTVLRPGPADRILDVGVSADDHVAANHLEKRYAYTSKVCGLGIDHLPTLISRFPGLEMVQGDARALPFADGSFDFVYSHAVIEHLGSREKQAKFIAEAVRVARKGVLLTTPNRWHPIESHTGLPLLHYLPQSLYHRLYRLLGKGMYASEETLNLLSSRQLLGLLRGVDASLYGVRWLGIRSNLFLVIRKS